ncbi:MAG: FAD-dependent monooxygenase [Rhodobacteraceae bacterium]|nr:FAD-dependent monooxygenase [Paracoccaceae bacterium]
MNDVVPPGRFVENLFEFRPPPGLSQKESRKNVVIVGAGPIGLAAALELANHQVHSVVLDSRAAPSEGSKAICWSKRSLEIFDRIGIGDRAVEKGVTWQVGRTYHRDREIFNFNLLSDTGHKRPAFINLQQYYVEQFLTERATENSFVDLRFANRVVGIEEDPHSVTIEIETQSGSYRLRTDWLLACDGVRSSIRSMKGLEFEGEVFEERFLITDIEMRAEFPPERRFWFEPTFHNGQSALLHKQPDNIYRIDLQLGAGADPAKERRPDEVKRRIERVVGTSDFRIEWVSVYTFQCRRLAGFVHGRVLFAGDSAHVVSPFGARGGNGGLQDVDSLCWRLAAIVHGRAGPELMRAYDRERVFAADENIANSTRTTKFMTPADGWERIMRDQLLRLATHSEFARAWVNSGRLSVPCIYESAGADDAGLPAQSRPGAVAPDAPQGKGWLIDQLGVQPAVMGIGCEPPAIPGARAFRIEVNESVRSRYLGARDRAVYLVRPDQVIAARWAKHLPAGIEAEHSAIWKEP